jgi:hypothetical protein
VGKKTAGRLSLLGASRAWLADSPDPKSAEDSARFGAPSRYLGS